MGQKVHPYGFRLGYIKTWHSSWYAKDRYADLLHEDLKIRAYIEKNKSGEFSIIVEFIKTFGKKVIFKEGVTVVEEIK